MGETCAIAVCMIGMSVEVLWVHSILRAFLTEEQKIVKSVAAAKVAAKKSDKKSSKKSTKKTGKK